MLRFIFSDFFDIVRGAKKAVIIIAFSVSITTAVILSFISILLDTVGTLQDLEYESRFYKIPVTSCYALPRMESVNQLLFGDYPEIKNMYPFWVNSFKLTDSFSGLTGGSGSYALYSEFDGYPVMDQSFCSYLYIPSPHIIRGRWFTVEEILNGDNVVVLSQPWLEENRPELNPDTLEIFTINDIAYRVVGLTDGVDKTLEEYDISSNYIPYRTMERNETDDSGFMIAGYQVFIEFVRPLTKDERLQIGLSFAQGGNVDLPMSNLDVSGSGYLLNTLVVFGIVVMMIFVCAINIMGLYRSVLKMNSYRYMVYKVCGARSSFISHTLRFTTVCFTVLSSICGGLLYGIVSHFVPKEFLPVSLPWYGYVVTILLMTGLLLAVVYPMIRDITRRQPLDRQLWR